MRRRTGGIGVSYKSDTYGERIFFKESEKKIEKVLKDGRGLRNNFELGRVGDWSVFRGGDENRDFLRQVYYEIISNMGGLCYREKGGLLEKRRIFLRGLVRIIFVQLRK